MSGYLTVDGQFEDLTVIERSKFICNIKGVQSEDEAKDFISQVKKIHSLATHNCYAYIADERGLIQKFSDDGEPQGTAGMPMLEVLKAKKLYKTVAVVTRYFGGVKLGAGGLVRAYSGAVSSCCEVAKIANMQPVTYFSVISDYEKYSKILSLTAKQGLAVVNTDFGDSISLTIAVFLDEIVSFEQALSNIFRGKAVYSKLNDGFYNFG